MSTEFANGVRGRLSGWSGWSGCRGDVAMRASIGVNMRVTGHYSQGGRKHMEDKFSVAYQQTEDERDLEYAYFGIFDGHGGSEAAAYAKDQLMEAIVRQKHFWSDDDADVLRAIRNGYMLTHMSMWKELEKWPKVIYGLPSTAGTTASVAFIRRGKIYIGHVGDSAIVLGYQVEGKDEWQAMPLTMDHKPESETEMQRILDSGGKVLVKAGVPRVVWNRLVMGKGKLCQQEVPFLAIARSLGDHWSYNTSTDEFAVSPDPDVGVLAIDPAKFRCLIFGTDGLWNMISPKKAVEIVQEAEKHNESLSMNPLNTWQNPSKILVDCAIDRWANIKVIADNTSVVTVMMDPPGPPRSRAPISRPLSNYCSRLGDVSKTPQKTHNPEFHESTSSGNSSCSSVPNQETTSVKASLLRPNSRDSIVPLPPVTNISQFQIPSNNSSPTQNNILLEDKFVTNNYGNPAESFFIARLLNKTQIRNSLQHVYDEILKSNIETVCQINKSEENTTDNDSSSESELMQNNSEDQSSCESTISEVSEITQNNIENEISKSESNDVSDNKLCVAEAVEIVNSVSVPEQESIQINEVSSSSPVENTTPKRRKRKSKSLPKCNTNNQYPVRNLRSQDTLNSTLRPQTRLNADKSRNTNNSVLTQNNQRKAVDSKVPVPVHCKTSLPSKKVVIIQPKSKTLLPPAVVGKQIPTTKTENKNNSQPQKLSGNNNNKLTDKVDNIVKAPSTRNKDSTVETSNIRITRSKDSQVCDGNVKNSKENNISKKLHIGKNNAETNKQKDFFHRNTTTRHKTVNSALTFCSQRRGGLSLRGRSLARVQGSGVGCFEKKKSASITPNTKGISLRSVKRRNSGDFQELEPKEKRKTRLGDKSSLEQHEDVTSTESLKVNQYVLSLRDSEKTCIPKPNENFTINSEDSANELGIQKVKSKNRKCFKASKAAQINENNVFSEVHSTTLNLQNNTLSCKALRTLRPRHDLQLLNRIGSNKRVLRSTICTSQLIKKSAIIKTKSNRHSLKLTMRCHIVWPQTVRHSLRKKFAKKIIK